MTNSTTEFDIFPASPERSADRSDVFFQMDKRKNEFLATLAHELRNPLAPIKNGLQLMAFMKLGEEAENVRAMMARQVEQIVHLVDDLLDVSRIGCGKLVLDKQVCIVKAIVDAAIEESTILISENGMTLEVRDNSQAACVCGDLSRLTQVICNLLNNSAKYGRIGGKIVLELDVCDGLVVIRVRDDGIGIAADRLQDIFRMYSQIESAQGRGSAGLGIGLALVRTLVDLHGGCVDAESPGPNCGSTFTVRLPLVTGILLENASKRVAKHSSLSYRVLVVDDMRAMRVVTEQLLVKLGHTVQLAENGKLALEMMDSFKPDVVFSDISMPGMSGHELARRIRERADLSSVYLVAMTGYGQPSDREMAFSAGFDRHLTKPVAIQRLRDLFDELDIAQHDNIGRKDLGTGGFHQR
ncbi:MAG: response regulator [Pirellulaceae bacterium]|nr:response regulator [Pirellulaceae bacterium]